MIIASYNYTNYLPDINIVPLSFARGIIRLTL